MSFASKYNHLFTEQEIQAALARQNAPPQFPSPNPQGFNNSGGGAVNFQVPKSFADQFRSVNQTPPPNPYANINQGNLGGGASYKQFEYPPPSSSQLRP